jgi:hypothetical protein
VHVEVGQQTQRQHHDGGGPGIPLGHPKGTAHEVRQIQQGYAEEEDRGGTSMSASGWVVCLPFDRYWEGGALDGGVEHDQSEQV